MSYLERMPHKYFLYNLHNTQGTVYEHVVRTLNLHIFHQIWSVHFSFYIYLSIMQSLPVSFTSSTFSTSFSTPMVLVSKIYLTGYNDTYSAIIPCSISQNPWDLCFPGIYFVKNQYFPFSISFSIYSANIFLFLQGLHNSFYGAKRFSCLCHKLFLLYWRILVNQFQNCQFF